MNQILYAKVCMVLTVFFAGLNIHQILSSYEYTKEKISEFQELVVEENAQGSMNVLSILFYFIIPGIYLFILSQAEFMVAGILLLVSKFAITAAVGLWTQRKVYRLDGYSRSMYLVGKADNILNIITAGAVAWLLLFPVG